MAEPARPAPSGTRSQRPPELGDWLNRRIYHPLAWRLAMRLAATPATPDMVSAAGAVTIALAALAYAGLPWPWSVALGLALHMSWHVLDGADGDLARITDRASPRGELIDGICDYLGHIALYFTLGGLAAGAVGPIAFVPMLAAGASRVVQAGHYEGARRQYQLAVYGTPWMASAPPAPDARGKRHPFVVYYLWLTGWIVPHGAALTAAAQDPTRREALRTAMRARGPAALARMSLLSANYRTLAVGAAMLAGQPLAYFLFEIVLLGGVLAVSVARVRRVFGQVLADIGAPPPSSTRR